jgi:hypothetical protein
METVLNMKHELIIWRIETRVQISAYSILNVSATPKHTLPWSKLRIK